MKKWMILSSVLAVVLLCGMLLLQAVSSVATSGDVYLHYITHKVNQGQLDKGSDLMRITDEIPQYFRNGEIKEKYFSPEELTVLSQVRQRLRVFNIVKYVMLICAVALILWTLWRYKLRGARTLALSFLCVGAFLALVIWILVRTAAFGGGADNGLLGWFIPDLRAYLNAPGLVAEYYGLGFLQAAGYGVLRLAGIIGGAIAIAALVITFCRAKVDPTDSNENYLYQ